MPAIFFINWRTISTSASMWPDRAFCIDAVRRWDYCGQPSGLAPHAATLEDHFRRHPPATVADAQATIERLTGVRRGPTQVRQFLKKVGPRVPQGPRRAGQGRPGRPAAVPG